MTFAEWSLFGFIWFCVIANVALCALAVVLHARKSKKKPRTVFDEDSTVLRWLDFRVQQESETKNRDSSDQ